MYKGWSKSNQQLFQHLYILDRGHPVDEWDMYICISHPIAISSLAVFFASQSANPQREPKALILDLLKMPPKMEPGW